MYKNQYSKKSNSKIILGALGSIAACTLLFVGLTNRVMAAELGKTETIPTSYGTMPTPVHAKSGSLPEGYTKADYTVKQDDLESVRNNKPTSKDLTQEQAAEAGAQALWEYFDVDLQGADIYMAYLPATENFPRARWLGDARFGPCEKPDGTPGTYCYTFSLDAVTGEIFDAAWGRTLAAELPLGPDAAIAENPNQYTDLAQEFAREHQMVNGEVKSAVYGGQGYSNNDPSVNVRVTGVNGEETSMTFSRYDQELLGISFDESIKIGDAALEKLLERTEKAASAAREKQTTDGGSPQMSILP